MNKIRNSLIFLTVSLFILCGLGLAETHRVEFFVAAKLGDVAFDPGRYTLKVTPEGVAEIYSGRKLLARAEVTLVPLEGATPRSVSQFSDGTLKEIRLDKQKLVFKVPALQAEGAAGKEKKTF